MSDPTLTELLERNRAYVDGLAEGPILEVEDGQAPAVVSICCSDSRVPQEAMFAVDEPGWMFTPSNIGNQVWASVDGKLVVAGSVLYPITNTGTRTAAVVGHTGCGAVTAALARHRSELGEMPAGIDASVRMLEPVVEAALEAGSLDPEAPSEALVDPLVEVNVHAQVGFLAESPEVPDDVDVYGFVYDLHGTYGGPRGRTYLVNANGERGVDALRELVPEGFGEHVASLLG